MTSSEKCLVLITLDMGLVVLVSLALSGLTVYPAIISLLTSPEWPQYILAAVGTLYGAALIACGPLLILNNQARRFQDNCD